MRKNLWRRYGVIALFVIGISTSVACGIHTEKQKAAYGVFVGADAENAGFLSDYETVVIDAAYFTKAEIHKLKQDDVTVYSYLNIGSAETFREYDMDDMPYILGEYENWPEEYWVDVSRPEWQAHIEHQAKTLAEKGIDGFFLDNADVYYQYPEPEIFQGLVTIINGLQAYQKDILINGGDVFVTEAVLEPETPLIEITGINQECVFTSIDFENDQLTEQEKDASEYYQDYLEHCKKAGLTVRLTEYAADREGALAEKIDRYCTENRFSYFIAPSKQLKYDTAD